MTRVGKHSGEPAEEESPPPQPPMHQRLPGLGAGVLATVVAWGFLVGRAIHFGSQSKHGESAAWFFMVLATLGAAACMFVAMFLGVRIMAVFRGDPLRRRATTGGKRAAR